MSLEISANSTERQPAFQPFQCNVCQSRFTRQENLKRHAALHTKSQDSFLACDLCQATFSRPDLRTRHLKRKHPGCHVEKDQRQGSRKRRSPTVERLQNAQHHHSNHEENLGLNSPGAFIRDAANTESISAPLFDQDLNISTFDATLASFSFDQWSPDAVMTVEKTCQLDWHLSESQIARGRVLFFDHVAPFLPIIHRATLDTNRIAEHLLLSMLCLAYQHGEDSDCGEEPGSGDEISTRCFHRARILIAAEEKKEEESIHSTTMVQSCLMLQIFAMMYSRGHDSPYGLKTHSKMISLARAGGLMQPIHIEPNATEDLDSLWHQFVRAESHKRTLFAVHQIDALWYQFLSIPRSLSHLEIKHDLPCPMDQWSASSANEWAHRQLVARNSGQSVRYSDAVRGLLSSDSEPVPPFDPYGAINITQFLISSAREVSGWSTMTGMVSIERLDPLRASLLALDTHIRPSSVPPNSQLSTLLHEATYEIAMIEMSMWSPSHTGGIVEGSIDAALHGMSFLSPSTTVLHETSIAELIRPHVDWFLRYLDREDGVKGEAPWVTLYAYKAFMIAWQLLQVDGFDAFGAVGVKEGDAVGALRWARRVFGDRERWKVGRVVGECLKNLEYSD